MRNVTIEIFNELEARIIGLGSFDLSSLSDQYAMFVKNHFHMPLVKLGAWDGRKRLLTHEGVTFIYLLETLVPKIIERGYKIKINDTRRNAQLPHLIVKDDIFAQYKNEHGEPYMLRDYQMYGMQAVLNAHGGILLAGTGSGKDQPLTSNVLTTEGWVKMGDITTNHTVITPDSSTAKVIGVYPQGNRDVYELTFHDGSKARAGLHHLWKVRRPVHDYRANTMDDIIETADIIDFLTKKADINKFIPGNISIPLTDPVETKSLYTLPMAPYLLGALLGDGGMTSQTPMFSNTSSVVLEQVQQHIKDIDELLQLKFVENSVCDYRITRMRGKKGANPIIQILTNIGLHGCCSNDKFIPQQYKNASVVERWELIRGLMDTDGTVCKRSSCSYTTVSHQLALDIQDVIWSLGGTCTITQRTPNYTYKGKILQGQLAYTLFIRVKEPKNLFSIPEKRERCLNSHSDGRIELMRRVVAIECVSHEPTQCIKIDHPEHLYITDDYVVTHNTIISGAFTKLYGDIGLRVITIVPTASLVLQSSIAFKEWGIDCGRLDKDIKDIHKTHLVTTWQSLQNIPITLANFDVIIVDECQAAQASVLSNLITEYGNNSLVRIGLTGTMPEYDLDNLMVRCMMGNVQYEIPAHELIKSEYLSTIDIDIVQLMEDIDEEYFPDYAAEMSYLRSNDQRNLWIRNHVVNLSEQPQGNVLMLVTSKQFGRKFAQMFPNAHFVCGDDHVKDRAVIYDLFKNNDNLIVITTVQVAGTGLSIDRIFNLVLLDLGKSFVRVIQAIGRGLRRNVKAGKVHCDIFDISSNLKYSKRHQSKRAKHYREHKYPFKITKTKYRMFNLDEIVD